jgi:TPR repeat protein
LKFEFKMRIDPRRVGLVLCFAVCMTGTAAADQSGDALTAYSSGNYAVAFQLYSRLAATGAASAEYNLGVMYAKGQGVEQNFPEALRWYRRAADQNQTQAQVSLGVLYAFGQGVPRDYQEAAKWYRKAADQGDPGAQNNLGILYDKIQGAKQDYAEAVKWYAEAARQRYPAAQNNLGFMYEKGRGVTQDYAQAYTWYSLAAAHYTSAEPRLKALALKRAEAFESKMTPGQITAAKKMVREWTPAHTHPTLHE